MPKTFDGEMAGEMQVAEDRPDLAPGAARTEWGAALLTSCIVSALYWYVLLTAALVFLESSSGGLHLSGSSDWLDATQNGIAAVPLGLLFGIVAAPLARAIMRARRRADTRLVWMLTAAYLGSALIVFGVLLAAYLHASVQG